MSTTDELTTAEFDAVTGVGPQLATFLEHLGRSVEPLADNRLVARHRTALGEEERKFKVIEAPTDRFLKTAVNVVAQHVPLPEELDDYPETYYFDEFLDHTVQAQRLSQAITQDPAIAAHREFFVPQHVAARGEHLDANAVDYFQQWLQRPKSRLLVILAPAGYGKTALTSEMSSRLASDYLDRESGSAQPFPYLVPFGEFRRLASFEAMILSSLQRKGVTDYTAPAFAYLVEKRRTVLMLDGFDELLEERPEEARKNLRELIDTLQGRGKVVVTARSTFFRTSEEVADFLEYGLAPDQVDVIELLSFDKHQRAQVIAKRLPTQKQIESIGRFIEAENVREAMGSPLLLRETLDALTDPEEETRLDRAAGRRDLFDALEHNVYARERTRHGHLFSDQTQRAFMQSLAEALLLDNARGFDFELVQVLAHEAGEHDEADESDLAQLADHHFLTVDHESDEARFNHQVFREYFQARAMIAACDERRLDRVLALLSQRPIPEEVRSFLAELDNDCELPVGLLAQLEDVARPSERLVENLGGLVAAYADLELLQRLLDLVPGDVGLRFDLVDMDLSSMDWSGRVLLGMTFNRCDVGGANFSNCTIGDLSVTNSNLRDANFNGASVDSFSLSGGARTFGTPDALRALSDQGAKCGLDSAKKRKTLEQTRREEVITMMRARLFRFYRPGQAGPEGSRWDSSIKENNLLGGVKPRDRRFTKRKLVPAMRSAGLIAPRRAHGEIIWDLTDDGEDDARALIELGEIRGKVADALRALSVA